MSKVDQSGFRKLCLNCGQVFDASHAACPYDRGLLYDPTQDPLSGQLVAEKYQVFGPIDAGGWSIVYRARHVQLGKDVALKILHSHLRFNEDKVKRFQQEAEAASKLNHPNIVSIFDYGVLDNQQPYLVMELVEGASMAELLLSGGPMEPSRAIPLFMQAAAALATAHAKGILHRDLKPSNMMVTSLSGQDTLKLLDFGIAKLMRDADAPAEVLTLTGEVFGSPPYMSPEQCRGLQLDQRSDVYSLGCLMFEVLTGERAIQAANTYEYMHAHVEAEPKPFKAARADLQIPKALQDVVTTALSKHREDRQQSMQVVLQELEAVASGKTPFSLHGFRFKTKLTRRARYFLVRGAAIVVIVGLCAMALQNYLQPASTSRTVEADSQSAPSTRRAIMVSSVVAPEFPADSIWLNVDKPLALKDLRGKVVLLDFWTYCCVNCLHILPELEQLKEKYGDKLVIIGVHSAKFDNERDTNNIRQAILRYGIDHPVVNDSQSKIWQAYGVNAWPSLVLIGTDGRVIHQSAGEGNFDLIDHAISGAVRDSGPASLQKAVAVSPEGLKRPPTSLRQPTDIAYDNARNVVYILDSGHNRIVAAGLDGKVQAIIGSGVSGKSDGAFDSASFNTPQGICFANGKLYVADTFNHLIRQIDPSSRKVKTIAGTGRRAPGINHKIAGQGLSVPLSSPWDVVVIGDKLYIAMAGFHQLWVLDLKTDQVRAFSGSAQEGLKDGSAVDAELAQPAGMSSDGSQIFLADSEVSAVRKIDSNTGAVKTLVGTGLFDFGDIDGPFAGCRLQHPLSVAPHNGLIYVADSFNHKIKVLDPARKTVSTLVGSGKPGNSDGDFPQFFEPSGLTIIPDGILVADTNNNAIRKISLQTGLVTWFTLEGLQPPAVRHVRE